jgi:hypothetical protein
LVLGLVLGSWVGSWVGLGLVLGWFWVDSWVLVGSWVPGWFRGFWDSGVLGFLGSGMVLPLDLGWSGVTRSWMGPGLRPTRLGRERGMQALCSGEG